MLKMSGFGIWSTWKIGYLYVFFMVLIAGSSVSGQSESDLVWAGNEVNRANPVSRQERYDIVSKLLERLESSQMPGLDHRELVHYLKMQKSYLAIDQDGLTLRMNEAVNSSSGQQRQSALTEVRYELLQRMASLSQVLTPNNISAEDAASLLAALKVASQALDDIRDPSILGGKASGITSLFNRASGLADFAASVKDPSAKSVVSGFDTSLGLVGGKLTRLGVSHPSPIKAFE